MFLKKNKEQTELIDEVFKIARKAKKAIHILGNDNVINASLGSLYDEDENFVALKSVFNNYRNLKDEEYAKYASSFLGNEEFINILESFIIENKLTKLHTNLIATSGGTGAITLAISNLLDTNETIILPNIGWSNYSLIAKEFNLKIDYYQLFDNDNNFNLIDLKNKITNSLSIQNKALIVINSPANNPTGYSIKEEEWYELVRFINEECNNKEVIILNDIAYIDYSFNLNNSRNYLKILDNLNENGLLIIAYSCSKAFTNYGLRLGASIVANKNKEIVHSISNAFNKTCRAYWSNVNNSAMINITNLLKYHKQEYLKEKDYYINLLKKRASIIIKEAKDINLPIYNFNEGFFITLKIDNNLKDKYHNELLNNNIYSIKVNEGIRIAICSLPIKKCYGLAFKLNELLNKIRD